MTDQEEDAMWDKVDEFMKRTYDADYDGSYVDDRIPHDIVRVYKNTKQQLLVEVGPTRSASTCSARIYTFHQEVRL